LLLQKIRIILFLIGFGITLHAIASELFSKGGIHEVLTYQGEWIGMSLIMLSFLIELYQINKKIGNYLKNLPVNIVKRVMNMARRIVEIKEIDWLGLTGYTLIVGFLAVIIITAAKGDIDTMKTVSSILGPFVGAVVTFFYGIKKLDKILKRVEALLSK